MWHFLDAKTSDSKAYWCDVICNGDGALKQCHPSIFDSSSAGGTGKSRPPNIKYSLRPSDVRGWKRDGNIKRNNLVDTENSKASIKTLTDCLKHAVSTVD